MTSWTVARQAPLSMEFSRQEYWSELPCPTPKDLPDLRMEPKGQWGAANLLGITKNYSTWATIDTMSSKGHQFPALFLNTFA